MYDGLFDIVLYIINRLSSISYLLPYLLPNK